MYRVLCTRTSISVIDWVRVVLFCVGLLEPGYGWHFIYTVAAASYCVTLRHSAALCGENSRAPCCSRSTTAMARLSGKQLMLLVKSQSLKHVSAAAAAAATGCLSAG